MKTSLIILVLLTTACASFAQDYYELTFTAGVTRHKGMLVAYEGSTNWLMRVKFYDTDCACTRLVEQDMQVENTADGIRLAGYRVRDAYTQRRVYDYAADNFYFYYDEYGNLVFFNYDDQGNLSKVSVSEVTPWNANTRLASYSWRQ